MKFAVTDNRIPKKAAAELERRGFSLFPMPPFATLSEPVSAHPDMLFFIGDALLCDGRYLSENRELLNKIAGALGIGITVSSKNIDSEYPNDIRFNAVKIGDAIFCRQSHIAPEILDYALHKELSVINVRQGYSKCSVCPVGERALITADRGIAKAASERGFDVLLIAPDGVRLTGCSCGFIGGASGTYGNDIYFCGNLALHPDGAKIGEFCRSHGMTVVSLSDEPLYDVGTVYLFGE